MFNDNCRYSIRYKGSRKPKCNDGEGCYLCDIKWELQEIARLLDRPLFNLGGKNDNETLKLYWRIRYSTFEAEKGEIK